MAAVEKGSISSVTFVAPATLARRVGVARAAKVGERVTGMGEEMRG